MKQPASFAPAWRAVLRYPMKLKEVKPPVHLVTSARDVFARCVPQANVVDDTAQARTDFILRQL